MNARTKRRVRSRAQFRCEYCHLPESVRGLAFHFDHVIAGQHGGEDDENNLALACARCNRHKGPNLSGIDPWTRQLTRLFNPRADVWSEHFEWSGAEVEGRTAIGRATTAVLGINAPSAVAWRQALQAEGFSFD